MKKKFWKIFKNRDSGLWMVKFLGFLSAEYPQKLNFFQKKLIVWYHFQCGGGRDYVLVHGKIAHDTEG